MPSGHAGGSPARMVSVRGRAGPPGRIPGMEFVLIAIGILVVALIAGIGLLTSRGRRTTRLDDDAAAGTTLTRPRPPAPTEEPRPSGSTATGLGRPPETAEP